LNVDEKFGLLKDGSIQSLLLRILKAGGQLKPDVWPSLDVKYGLEEIEGEYEDKLKALERVVEAGVLHKRFYTKIVKCPFCGSKHVLARCQCTRCGSVNIMKKFLLEHLKCGGKAEEGEFKGVGGLCPLCGGEMKEGEVNRVGSWFECVNCGQRFSEPILTHSCAECGGRFTLKEVELETVYSYAVDENVEAELKRLVNIMDPLRKAVPKGYIVETLGVLTGSSEVEHQFDMIVYKQGKKAWKTVIDVAVGNSMIREENVAKMFVKVLDTRPGRSILVAVPGMTEGGRRLASLYKIELVEGGDVGQAAEKLRNVLKTP
jgi:predicted  nucleic acid-binding Zn-ribbon protein